MSRTFFAGFLLIGLNRCQFMSCFSLRNEFRPVMHRGPSVQLCSHPMQHPSPVSRRPLPKEPRSRIPGRGLDLLHPAPVGEMRQQNPHRLAHGAGEMRDRGVGSDHQIERRNQCCGLGQIVVMAAAVRQANISGQRCNLSRRGLAFLQGEPVDVEVRSKGSIVSRRMDRGGPPCSADCRPRRCRCAAISADLGNCVRFSAPRPAPHQGTRPATEPSPPWCRKTAGRLISGHSKSNSARDCRRPGPRISANPARTTASECISRSTGACTSRMGNPPRAATSVA